MISHQKKMGRYGYTKGDHKLPRKSVFLFEKCQCRQIADRSQKHGGKNIEIFKMTQYIKSRSADCKQESEKLLFTNQNRNQNNSEKRQKPGS